MNFYSDPTLFYHPRASIFGQGSTFTPVAPSFSREPFSKFVGDLQKYCYSLVLERNLQKANLLGPSSRIEDVYQSSNNLRIHLDQGHSWTDLTESSLGSSIGFSQSTEGIKNSSSSGLSPAYIKDLITNLMQACPQPAASGASQTEHSDIFSHVIGQLDVGFNNIGSSFLDKRIDTLSGWWDSDNPQW